MINSWMDKGWTAQQIIADHAEPVQPPAPAGFGDEYVEPVEETVVEEPVEPVVEEEEEIESEPESATSKSLMRLKKAELVELANLQGIDSSGTKSDIVGRLLG
jgi:hypothetical protein